MATKPPTRLVYTSITLNPKVSWQQEITAPGAILAVFPACPACPAHREVLQTHLDCDGFEIEQNMGDWTGQHATFQMCLICV